MRYWSVGLAGAGGGAPFGWIRHKAGFPKNVLMEILENQISFRATRAT